MNDSCLYNIHSLLRTSPTERLTLIPRAGVIGLTTALLLSRKGFSVTVAAKHMPGDYDIEYASPWAGANYAYLRKALTDELC
jgi:hypothetical protein